MNIAVVVGDVVDEVHEVVREDGTVLLSFDLRVEGPTGGATARAGSTVPLSWIGPATRVPKLEPGLRVTAVGSVRRRFYRRGGTTVSRTDVLADRVVVGPLSRSRVARGKAADAIVAGVVSPPG